MPRLQPHHHHQHHHSPSPARLHPTTTTPSTPLRPKTKQPMNKLLASSTTTPTKKTPLSTTPNKPSTPKPNPPSYRKQPTKSKRKNILAPNPPKNHGTLSLLSFYDLSAELYSLSSHSNPKLKASSRRTTKNSNHHALVLPQSSDSEVVHSIFLPFSSQHSSRSSTPTPTKASGIAPSDPFDLRPFTLDLDESLPPSISADRTPTPPRTFTATATTSTPALPAPRRHVRAKSVASIFELDKSTKAPSQGVRDDWDMPTVLPTRDLTWQQKGKKAPLATHSSPSVSHQTQNLIQHDSLKSSTRSMANLPPKEATPARHQKSTLARTSSAGTISRLLPPSAQPTTQPPAYSSRSDDESALTWQQSIIRPLPKPRSLPAPHSNHTLTPPDNKCCGHKKNQGTPNSLKTPVKTLPIARKAGVQSAVKSKPSSLQPSSRRRNSLSSGHTSHSQKQSDITPIQAHESIGSSSFSSGAVQDVLSWKSFPTSAVVNHQPDLPPLRSNPLPIVGAQVDQTPPRRHTKSHTLQPATLSNRKPSQPSHSHTVTSAPAFSNIPELTHHKMMTTPSKSRATSEDLNLASPEKQLTTPALRAAFMYAGPQFHNSPCPAALPAPKFSFGSA